MWMESILQEISGCSVYLKIDLLCRDAMAHLDSEVKEECLREDLRFYFMNPCEKFRARQQIPWKMGLQILKIVMVTTQVMILSVHLFFILTPSLNCFSMFCHLTFVLKRPHTHVHKPLKLCWLWRADGRLKFSLDDDFVLVRDFEIISHGLCKYR